MGLGTKQFIVTDDHIKLLQAMYIGWEDCEYGAPAVDCKRPYGNSDVPHDIAEELGWPWPDEDNDDDYEERVQQLSDRARQIHEEMQTALQILVRNLSIEPGVYEADAYHVNWRKVR